jgi:hypothetical protein
MVGTNPFTGGNVQTVVPSVIIPFRFVFADGTVMDGTQDVAATIASPIFSDYTYPRELSGPPSRARSSVTTPIHGSFPGRTR